MRNGHDIAVVIPALNEERAIGHVLAEIPNWVDRVIVVDNGSTDRTGEVARSMGAIVVGVSTQSTEYQREAAQRLQLPFSLLRDADLQLAARCVSPHSKRADSHS